jgi:DNA-binding NarL/FixJ family response regulator
LGHEVLWNLTMLQLVGTSTLTPRQAEIAGLVAAGLTNAEIADRLHLMPGTVSQHVGTILLHLGLRRRRELASWMIEQAWRMQGR